jgi:predicted permease
VISEFFADLRSRLRAVFRRATVERELDVELRFHIEREMEKNLRAGMSRDEAERRARLAVGGLNRIKDDARDARGVTVLDHALQDIHYALRGLRMRPLFASVVVATLALGVGVNAAMFGVIDRLLFRPPAYMIDPAHVHRVFAEWAGPEGKRSMESAFAYPQYTDLRDASRGFTEFAGFANRRMAIGEGEQVELRTVGVITASFFGFFTATPVVGRFFLASEDALSGGEPVVVLAYDFWQTRFGGNNSVLGTSIKIDKRSYTVIGVAPRGFEGVKDQRAPAVFIPMSTFAHDRDAGFAQSYGWTWLQIIARRKPTTSVATANADLTNAFRRSWTLYREREKSLAPLEVAKPIAVAAPLQMGRGPLAGPQANVIRWIGAVAFAVLLIACANVANLLLAHSLRRRREIAVRRAMGGSNSRLVQQILTETLVLATLGTVAGLFAAQFASGSLQRLLAQTSDRWPVVSDLRTVSFAIGLTLLTALLAGLLPALHAGRGDLTNALRAGMREGAYRNSRIRTSLLLFQTALSVVLLVGAGLFVRSLREVKALPLGYDAQHLLYVEPTMRDVKLDSVQALALADRLTAEAKATPGVTNATLIVSVPFYSSEGRGMWVEGIDSVRKLGRFQLQSGTAEYFATTGTRIIRGRAINADDRAESTPVAVVSDGMAKALWKRTNDALGKCFRVGKKDSPCITVVGVAEDIRTRSITSTGEFIYYLPMPQYINRFGALNGFGFFIRVNGEAEARAEPLRVRLQKAMPGSSFVTVRPFRDLVDPQMLSWTSGAQMFLLFGALALSLAAIGLYAVIAFGVAQRRQELGVRIALGAQSNDILRLVLGEGLRVTIGGLLLGGAIALFAGRALNTLLFNVSPRDPLTFSIVTLTLVVVGIFASVIPAWRAARVDPNVALRAD